MTVKISVGIRFTFVFFVLNAELVHSNQNEIQSKSNFQNQFQTRGQAESPICSGQSQKKALVIIDMQQRFIVRNGRIDLDLPVNRVKLEKLVQTQVIAIHEAKRAKTPIILVEFKCDKCGETIDKVKRAIGNYSELKIVKKTTDGMLDSDNASRGELEQYLKKHNIGTLILMGINGGACVAASMYQAFEQNCSIIALTPGIADFNYDEVLYPFDYGSMVNLPCSTCSFKEISTVEAIIGEMGNNATTNIRSNKVDQISGTSSGVR